MPMIPGLTVKAIINRFNGMRFEGAELTDILLEYAEKNRDHFNFIYTGDVIEAASGDRIENTPKGFAPQPEVRDPLFTKDQLLKLSKNHLLELAESMKLTIEGEPDKGLIADLIIAEQMNKKGA